MRNTIFTQLPVRSESPLRTTYSCPPTRISWVVWWQVARALGSPRALRPVDRPRAVRRIIVSSRVGRMLRGAVPPKRS